MDGARSQGDVVGTVPTCQPRHRAAVEPDAIEVPLDGALLGRLEINGTLPFVDSRKSGHLPGAAREPLQKLAAEVIKIEVTVSVALTRPQKPPAVGKEIEVVVHVDPVLI